MPDAKRPWQGAETRLRLKIFGRDTSDKMQPDAGYGWALHRLRRPILDEGEIAVPMSDLPDHIELTGAEYWTLREECGLSISEISEFHDVREDTIKKWGKFAPPGGAAAELIGLRMKIEVAARKALDVYMNALSQNPDIEGVDLYRFHTWAYPKSAPASEGLPHGAHNRLISKTADLLAANQVQVTIEYWSPDIAG